MENKTNKVDLQYNEIKCALRILSRYHNKKPPEVNSDG